MTSAINIQSMPTPQIWVGAVVTPPGSGNVITDEAGNVLTDEAGNVLTDE